MYYLCFISVVDSRDKNNLKYKKFKFKIPCVIETSNELIEVRNKVNSFFNTNNVSVYDYIGWAIKNLPYSKNQCTPRVCKVHCISDIFNDTENNYFFEEE